MAEHYSVSASISKGSTSDPTDADLVANALTDDSAFEELYIRYIDVIYRYCYRRLPSSEAAADAASQTFMKAFAGLAGHHGTSFRSWLFSIAHNTIVDEMRRHRPTEPLEKAERIRSGDELPEEAALRNESRLEIVKLLEHLTPDQRSVVELRLAGLSGNEIADVLGRSRSSVDTAQSRAVARLRKVLDASGQADSAKEVTRVTSR